MKVPVLETKGVSKRFPGVQALDNVNMEAHVGEILAVIGENGAGKSTLMKILGGIYQPDSGDIFYNGKKVIIDSVQTATRLGVALIHQELNLADNLDIASNVFLGREPRHMGPLQLIDRRSIYKKTQDILDTLGVDRSPNTIVTELTIGQQQMVEIAKALSVNACVLIMDEPTSSLSNYETKQLFEVMGELKSQGVSIIYVSHRLGEVKEIADRVTVLRDGCNSGNLLENEIDREQMVKMMVGRNIEKYYHHVQHNPNPYPVLEVKGIRTVHYPRHEINFTLYSGEILVMAGLIGAGRTELLNALFGIEKPLSGKVLVEGKVINISSPRDAVDAGMVLIPEDRRQHGLVLEMTVEENITLAGLNMYQKYKLIQNDKVQQVAEKMVGQFNIRTPGTDQMMELLSGGNQQKAVLAKWLSMKPKVLLMDEPTRGVDVIAKEEIYRFMEELASEGVGILVASSEMHEVLGIADRILVMRDGYICGELTEERFSEEAIVSMFTGGNE